VVIRVAELECKYWLTCRDDAGVRHPSHLIRRRDGGGASAPDVNDMPLYASESVVEVERPLIRGMNRYDADLFAVHDGGGLGKPDGAIGFAAHKLLEAMFIELVHRRYTDDDARATLDLLHPYQNVSV
jgi:hypothetical protein